MNLSILDAENALGGAPFWLILSLSVVLFIVVIIVMWSRRYKRCPSDKILVVFGKVGGGTGGSSSKCIHGGAAFIWPIFQDYKFLDLTPISIEVELKRFRFLNSIYKIIAPPGIMIRDIILSQVPFITCVGIVLNNYS